MQSGGEYQYLEYASGESGLQTSTRYIVMLPMTNTGTFVVNGEELSLWGNMLILLRPGDKYAFSWEGEGSPILLGLSVKTESMEALFTYLGAEGEALYQKLLDSARPPVSVLSLRERQRMHEGIRQFHASEASCLTLRFFLSEALGLFAKGMHAAAESDVPAWLERTCIQMEKKENFVEGLPRMIAISGKTREHLARSMQRYKHTTISEFINNLRLEYAAGELAGSDIRIIDLCFESGFTSLDYFGKLFKKKYGMAPTAFRNRSR